MKIKNLLKVENKREIKNGIKEELKNKTERKNRIEEIITKNE
jgi:hypothetical protein